MDWRGFPLSHTNSESAYTGQVAHVIDGDTLVLRGRERSTRLWGVDAPERDERGFSEAKTALAAAVDGQPLACHHLYADRYLRSVARCFRPDGQEINRMMIESGTATEFRADDTARI